MRAPAITSEMKVAAALALAGTIGTPTAETILPHPLDRTVLGNCETRESISA